MEHLVGRWYSGAIGFVAEVSHILFFTLLHCRHSWCGSFTSLPTQATSSLTPGTQTQGKRIPEVFGMDTCKFCFFSSRRLYIGTQCDAYSECCLKVPAHVHIIISCHSNHFHNSVLCYGFLFSLLIGFSSFPCLCNADACWIHDLDPTYFLTLFHWFILDPELVHIVPSSCLIWLQNHPSSIFPDVIVTSSS
jgi:hypothetical protein